MAERKLPQNLEAEMNVLGCAFLTTYALEKVCEELSSDMFLSEANKRIFEAIYELHQNKIPLDSATVKNEIEKKGSINIIGGIEYLSDVIDSVITAANVDYYIDIVRDKALRRKLIDVTTNITTNAYNEESDTNDIIDDAEKRIFSVTKARKAGEFKSIGEVIRSTHEELFTIAAKSMVRSYKDLPFTIYQDAPKYRDEARPRFGLIRVREFFMKDAYSFDKDEEGLSVSYQKMYDAYKNIFDRIGLNYAIVRADTGVMGGSLSEEFQAITDIGEDVLVLCDKCDYASNMEIATHLW